MSENSPERKFLHDISTPVGTALFLTDLMLETLKEENSAHLDQMTSIFQALTMARKMIEERRETIIKATQMTGS